MHIQLFFPISEFYLAIFAQGCQVYYTLIMELGGMGDREWMLNPQAIRLAKKCITLVKEEFGEKLTLSDPNFMQSLHHYTELSKTRSLGTSYGLLLSKAGVGNVLQGLLPKGEVARSAEGMTLKAAAGAERLAASKA